MFSLESSRQKLVTSEVTVRCYIRERGASIHLAGTLQTVPSIQSATRCGAEKAQALKALLKIPDGKGWDWDWDFAERSGSSRSGSWRRDERHRSFSWMAWTWILMAELCVSIFVDSMGPACWWLTWVSEPLTRELQRHHFIAPQALDHSRPVVGWGLESKCIGWPSRIVFDPESEACCTSSLP